MRQRLRERRLPPVARAVRRDKLTYLSVDKLENLTWALGAIAADGVPGDVIEAGVALGGSGIVLASGMGPRRRFAGYDVFGMIPAPGEADDAKSHARYEVIASGASKGLGGEQYYGYREDLYADVERAFARYGLDVDGDRIALHRGRFEETLSPAVPVALAHLDCDWYEPVRLCLDRLCPLLAPGGIVISDDYHDYGGCRRAVDEVLDARDDLTVVRDAGSLVMRRAT